MSNQQQVIIHPTAIIEKGAELGVGVFVGPYCVIGPKVKIGDRTKLQSHVNIQNRTFLGADNKVWPFASIGTEPQDLKFYGEDSELIVGDNNKIREYSNLSTGTEAGGMLTKVGDGNLFMVSSHVAHDCIVGNENVIANGVSLAGHVTVGNQTIIGGHSAIHQFSHIGDLAMIAGGSIVVQDVLPYLTVHGNHAKPSGLNLIGLKRRKYIKEQINEIKKMYKLTFSSSLTIEEATAEIMKQIPQSEYQQQWLHDLKSSKRGVCR